MAVVESSSVNAWSLTTLLCHVKNSCCVMCVIGAKHSFNKESKFISITSKITALDLYESRIQILQLNINRADI